MSAPGESGGPLGLAALLAHELTAPLVSLELELRALLSANACREPAERALEQVSALRETVSALLDLQAGEVARERFPLQPVLRRVAERFDALARARGIRIHRDETPMDASGDARATERVVANLVDNALKFSPEGSSVRIQLSASEGGVRVSVVDEGPGLDERSIHRVFDPFVRLDRSLPGAGLGLSLAKHLAEIQGGRLTVASAPGRGSRFTLELSAP